MSSLKSNKIFSFTVMAIIYAAVAAAGIAVYWATDKFALGAGREWASLLIADIAATVLCFAFSYAFKNASVYDPYWSVQPVVIVFAFMFAYGFSASAIGFAAVIAVWGVRLTANWAYSFGDLTHQDWRYTMLREKTNRLYPVVNFVGIHLVPTLVVYGCCMPAVEIVLKAPDFTAGSGICLSVSLLAVILQGTADIQMHMYRKNRDGTFIRKGVWKYSRHPNYLAEIVMWWGIAAAMLFDLPSSWYLVFGAFANTCLFMFVSIPLAEGKQSKKDGYALYKAQTRMLLPFYKKQTALNTKENLA